MNVLLLGSGGREHAFAWKIAQSNSLTKLFIAPGNAGTSRHGTNIPIRVNDFESIGAFAIAYNITLVVVGPEDPLVNGLRDFFSANQKLKEVLFVGPDKSGAILEGSKKFAKEFMRKYNIPTARYKHFTKTEIYDGFRFIDELSAPFVLKADGLAAGKGVIITNTREEAKSSLEEMLEGQFGSASSTVVIEEFLQGIELSVFVISDGQNYKILPEAKDYKRIGEGDTGLNTGGMGAVSPVPFATPEFMQKVETKIIKPTINGLSSEQIDYKGFIFFGLMNVDGNPYVIEYNVRMGDPETEVVLPRIKSDMLELLIASAQGNLPAVKLETDNKTVATIMLVSKGYPEAYEKQKEIANLDKVNDSIIFHAGTKASDGKILTNGGRVLAVSSFGQNKDEALEVSRKNADIISFEGKTFRRDIGFDL